MSKFKIFISLFTLFFVNTSLHANEGNPKIFKTKYGEQLKYRLYSTKSTKKLPLIIFMHGAGERGTDNKKQTTHAVPELIAYSRKTKQPIHILSPQVGFSKKNISRRYMGKS